MVLLGAYFTPRGARTEVQRLADESMLSVTSAHPIPDHLVRVLMYVGVANAGGGYPSWSHVDAYARTQVPRGPELVSLTATAASGLSSLLRGFGSFDGGEPVAHYLVEMGWLGFTRTAADETGLKLTTLGRAIVRGLKFVEAEGDGEDGGVTIISPEDPFRYSTLTRAISEAGQGMLVDPFFKPDMLRWLSSSTNITRVLLKVAVRKNEREEQSQLLPFFLGALGTVDDPPKIQVRLTSSETLHDRGVVHEGGNVSLLGTSLSGIGKHLTAIVPLPGEAAAGWRSHIEELWREATAVEPTYTIRNPTASVPEGTGRSPSEA